MYKPITANSKGFQQIMIADAYMKLHYLPLLSD